ncbi:MAG: hypothetical protein JAY73_18075, partial [Candidatus Thiodiazotropha taylori]|nr:hypothetical protein [Candidatus Thiodiazotropha taylori]
EPELLFARIKRYTSHRTTSGGNQESRFMKALQSDNYRKLKKTNPDAFQEWIAGKSDTVKKGGVKLRIVPVRNNKKSR